MVQVDIFWSYAFGAGFALAASRQLATRKLKGENQDSENESTPRALMRDLQENSYFTKALLFLALVFGPSGAYLLWGFTSWETMHAGTYQTIPVWLATLFAFTNMSQGILGFFIAYWLIRKARPYVAFLTFMAAYFGFWFILVHGWDGSGYQRFFSPTREAFLNGWTWSTAADWLTSGVALSLYGMGVILLPLLFAMTSRWIRAGLEHDGSTHGLPARDGVPSHAGVIMRLLAAVFVGGLGSAIGASLIIRLAITLTGSMTMGSIAGALIAAAIIAILGARRGGYLHWMYREMLWMRKPAAASRRITPAMEAT